VSARLPVEDLGELFDIDLPDDDVETVGGLLAQLLGRVPLPGSEATIQGLHLLGEYGEDRRGRPRVQTLLVRRVDTERDEPDGADPAAERTAERTGGHDFRADERTAQNRDRGSTGRPAKSERPPRNGAASAAGADIGSAVNRTNPRTERDHAR